MRLRDLQAGFLRVVDDRASECVDDIAQADGVWFLCPKCFSANGNSDVGTHWVICWSPKVPQTRNPVPGRWELRGTGLDDLSLVAGSSSILLTGEGCGAHFWITKGEIVGLT
jgi:hypothetical protein